MFDRLTGIQNWFKNSSPQKKLVAVLLVVSLMATGIFFIVSGGAEAPADPMASAPLYMLSVFVKLIGVLLLIVISAVLYRRWMHIGSQTGAARQLRLLETVRLSPKQTLYLVAVADQQLLIGATDQNISLLSQIDGSFTGAQIEAPLPQPASDFDALVQSFNSNLPAVSLGGKE